MDQRQPSAQNCERKEHVLPPAESPLPWAMGAAKVRVDKAVATKTSIARIGAIGTGNEAGDRRVGEFVVGLIELPASFIGWPYLRIDTEDLEQFCV